MALPLDLLLEIFKLSTLRTQRQFALTCKQLNSHKTCQGLNRYMKTLVKPFDPSIIISYPNSIVFYPVMQNIYYERTIIALYETSLSGGLALRINTSVDYRKTKLWENLLKRNNVVYKGQYGYNVEFVVSEMESGSVTEVLKIVRGMYLQILFELEST